MNESDIRAEVRKDLATVNLKPATIIEVAHAVLARKDCMSWNGMSERDREFCRRCQRYVWRWIERKYGAEIFDEWDDVNAEMLDDNDLYLIGL